MQYNVGITLNSKCSVLVHLQYSMTPLCCVSHAGWPDGRVIMPGIKALLKRGDRRRPRAEEDPSKKIVNHHEVRSKVNFCVGLT